jgi:hypothetical protein
MIHRHTITWIQQSVGKLGIQVQQVGVEKRSRQEETDQLEFCYKLSPTRNLLNV